MTQVTEYVCDAGDLGCGDGLASWFRNQLSQIPIGAVMCSTMRDPAARVELPALARMMGQRILSVETLKEGVVIKVERMK